MLDINLVNDNFSSVQQLDVDPASVAAGAGVLTGGPLIVPYNILQLHFHWGSDDTKGSEHTYSGREYPIEMHIVHTRSDFTTLDQILNTATGLAVTGFMFEVDSHFLQSQL